MSLPKLTVYFSGEKQEVNCLSTVDPHGKVFFYRGQFYRILNPTSTPFYKHLLSNSLIKKFMKTMELVPTQIASDISHTKNDCVLIHSPISPSNYCVEWSPLMFKDAALFLLDMSLQLLDNNMLLQDAFPGNIMFKNCYPVMIDFTSIVPITKNWLWPAYEQFQSFFLHPLFLMADGKDNIARKLLFDTINGININDLFSYTSFFFKLRRPTLSISYVLNKIVHSSNGLRTKLKKISLQKRNLPIDLHKKFILNIKKKVQDIKLHSSGEEWGNYYKEIKNHIDKEKKISTIREIIAKISPSTVLDVGCNTGIFSILAESLGAQVIAIDTSNLCIDKLYIYAKNHKLKILPLVANILTPTPAFGFMAQEYDSLLARIRCDLTLFLGIMHHAHIAGRQSFERIASLLSAITIKTLIFEYVDKEDENNYLIPRTRDIEYTLPSVKQALETFFTKITIMDSDRPTRKLLICEK